MVADDDTEIAVLVEILLQREGYDVVTAMNGSEALRLIEQKRPDVLVLDIMMPNLNGYEVVQRLREKKATRFLPVILLSARAGALDRKYGIRMGADDYVLKPFQADDLLERIRSVLPSPATGEPAAPRV
ncbi:MAG: two-component system, OmpR family, alkaline phosphatase synthesis response regulator PhoP [Thermoleophilaceae bacterium]|jgi:DNA-binding response OmpR family regulator|nr:two-component system, OmpR family, alkaline phosphatase synthesis response regulator PhoP [Thermoleophilaceae bacterium]